MDKKDAVTLKGRIVTGVVALTTRTFLLQVIAFTATFILTIILSPSVFGVFFVVSAVISFLSYFSDIGLAAALIQKKSEPTRQELVSSFTLQQILVGGIVILALLVSPFFTKFYRLNADGLFLLQALLISFFLSSLKTIPSVLLERKLQYAQLVLPQIAETVVFYTAAIVLALLGFSVRSFAWASIARGVIGIVVLYGLAPWRIGLGISLDSIRELLSFGIPFQVNSMLALVKDDLMTIFLGKFLPFTYIGYIGWAKKWAEVPLRLIMDSVVRVTFPTYSRLQEDTQFLKKAINKSMFFLALFIFPAIAILIIGIQPMINIFPKYTKWQPAVFSFYLFSLASVFSAFSSPLVNALNALGKIKLTLKLMIFWTVLTWILVPLLITLVGFNGVSIALFIISLTGIIPIFIMKRSVQINFLYSIIKPLLFALISFGPVIILKLVISIPVILLGLGILSVFIYALLIWLFLRQEVTPYLRVFRFGNK
jgi:O-antigen/teichoic acid export membrane protein